MSAHKKNKKRVNLIHLLDSFHREKPKGRRVTPSWNLSLVLHQQSKAPFEPFKRPLKHLTFETVFHLVLGSVKHRSEIHAWQNKKTSDISQTGLKYPCTPHPAFCPRTCWPKGVQIVWPQWLYQPWPQLWISHSSLIGPCVQSEHCTTFWTGPQTQAKQGVVFVSFKKDISSCHYLFMNQADCDPML